MTTKLDQALEQVRKLPRERQDHIADVLPTMATPLAESDRAPEQIAAIGEGLADAAAGRLASPDDMEAFLARDRGAWPINGDSIYLSLQHLR